MNWAAKEPGRRGLTVADLSDGETAEFRALGEPYRKDTEYSDDALHIPVEPVEVPDGYTDMSGDGIDDQEEYVIINSSASFYEALCSALGIEPGTEYDGAITSSVLSVTAHQPDPNDDFSRTYTVEFE